MSLFERVNLPLGVDEALSVHGSDWLWAVTAAYFALTVICFTVPECNRVFHYMFTVTLLVGATTSYAQASDLGWSAVTQADGATRHVFFARYINWTLTFPSFALDLGLLSGISWTTISCNIFVAWVWVLGYLVARTWWAGEEGKPEGELGLL